MCMSSESSVFVAGSGLCLARLNWIWGVLCVTAFGNHVLSRGRSFDVQASWSIKKSKALSAVVANFYHLAFSCTTLTNAHIHPVSPAHQAPPSGDSSHLFFHTLSSIDWEFWILLNSLISNREAWFYKCNRARLETSVERKTFKALFLKHAKAS